MSRYIDADNLVNVKILGIHTRYADGWNDSIDAIRECEPTADVRPNVHGEWIKIDNIKYDHGKMRNLFYFKCSNCGKKKMFDIDNFCPNCGADMRKEVEE